MSFCVAGAVFGADPLCVEYHFAWQAQFFGHFTLYTPHSAPTHHTLLNFTLHTSHCILYILRCTLYTLHSTLSTPRTLHSALYTLHSTTYNLHFTFYTLQSTLYNSNFSVQSSWIDLFPVLPPTDSLEVIVHIDTQRPLQLCYTFAVCYTCAAFCLATLLFLIFTTVAKICLAVPVLTWCAVLLLMLRACSTEAQQGVGA